MARLDESISCPLVLSETSRTVDRPFLNQLESVVWRVEHTGPHLVLAMVVINLAFLSMSDRLVRVVRFLNLCV